MTTTIRIIAFAFQDEYQMVQPDQIRYVVSSGNYSILHLCDDRELMISKNLKEIQKLLPIGQFVRVHKQFIVNAFRISKYIKSDSTIILLNGKILPVAVRKKKLLLNHFTLA